MSKVNFWKIRKCAYIVASMWETLAVCEIREEIASPAKFSPGTSKYIDSMFITLIKIFHNTLFQHLNIAGNEHGASYIKNNVKS